MTTQKVKESCEWRKLSWFSSDFFHGLRFRLLSTRTRQAQMQSEPMSPRQKMSLVSRPTTVEARSQDAWQSQSRWIYDRWCQQVWGCLIFQLGSNWKSSLSCVSFYIMLFVCDMKTFSHCICLHPESGEKVGKSWTPRHCNETSCSCRINGLHKVEL